MKFHKINDYSIKADWVKITNRKYLDKKVIVIENLG